MVVNMVPGAPSLGKVDDDSHLLIQGDLAAEGGAMDDHTIVTDETATKSQGLSRPV